MPQAHPPLPYAVILLHVDGDALRIRSHQISAWRPFGGRTVLYLSSGQQITVDEPPLVVDAAIIAKEEQRLDAVPDAAIIAKEEQRLDAVPDTGDEDRRCGPQGS